MESSERAARLVLRHLAEDERLLASVVGREVRDGWARRRVAVAATDRRLLLIWMRPSAPTVSLAYAEVSALEVSRDDIGQTLAVTSDGTVHAVRAITDATRLRLFTELVRGRLPGN